MARPFLDLTGQVFGRLTVIKRHPVDYITPSTGGHTSRWIVRCSCGKHKVVLGTYLTGKRTRSCSCLQKEKQSEIGRNRTKDLTGQTLGSWTALEKTDQRYSSGSVMWLCRCKCGREKLVSASHLIRGCSTQCRICSTTTHGLSHTKDYINTQTRRRKEKEHQLDAEWTLEMEAMLVQQQPFCAVCSQPAQATDHVLPLSKGYGLAPGNAVRLCGSCNSRKHAKLLENLPVDWRIKIRYAALKFKRKWESKLVLDTD